MNAIYRTSLALTALLATVALSGCVTVLPPQPGQFAPTRPYAPQATAQNTGTIYQDGMDIRLYDDPKAGRVGDILTILLVERTQASKSAESDSSKSSSVDMGTPRIAGQDVTIDGNAILDNQFETEQDFQGGGSASQSNSLSGQITVTVLETWPNDVLVVQGEKWLTLNTGEEFIQISGLVRRADILPDNTVRSDQVADARIVYSGAGQLHRANHQGWLGQFFMSGWWPL